MITDATFWRQSPEARAEQIPSLDPHCLVCGQSLEGQPFFWELYMGPQLDIAGMHLRCAYLHSLRVLNEIASNDTGPNDTDAQQTRPPRSTYTEQPAASETADDSDDADDAIFEVSEDIEDEPQPVHASYPPDTSEM